MTNANPCPDPSVRVMAVQRFCLHDGPGIRTTVFLQGCSLHCPWCSNPESQPLHPVQRHRRDKCVRCLRCTAVCPEGLIRPGKDGYPLFDRTRCTACGACESECPCEAISVSGKIRRCSELLEIIGRDLDYYRNSGGGVTFSGGEALLQPEGLCALLHGAKKMGIHTAVETCGDMPAEALQQAEPLTDLFLCDLKHCDAQVLKRVTGGCLNRILDNLAYLAARGKAVLRIPCIPGFNLDKATLQGIFSTAVRMGVEEIHLLPYHTLGADKYAQLGRRYTFPPEMTDRKDLEPFAALGRAAGLTVRIGG